jgi:LPS export ABC transporter protein LptC
MTMFFSCQSNFKEIQKLNATEKFPSGIAENFTLTYTEYGKVKAILSSPLNKDFSNQEFPYQEFSNGVKVDFYDENNNKSTVTANYGIIYSATNLIDLREDVVLQTYDGKRLETSQLFWDEKNEWVFTEKNYTFTSQELNMSGIGIDFDKHFNQVNSHNNSGSAVIKD